MAGQVAMYNMYHTIPKIIYHGSDRGTYVIKRLITLFYKTAEYDTIVLGESRETKEAYHLISSS